MARKKLWVLAVVGVTALAPAIASAESITTTDGIVVVNESVAPLGSALSYVSGGDGLIGNGATWPVPGTPAGAASAYDHQWLQFDPAIIWSSPVALSAVFAIPGIDHGPVPQENLEFIIWGADVAGGPWEEGKISAIYRDGFDTANTELGHSDDYTSLWVFTKPYKFFRATSGDHLIPAYGSVGEGEIDALARPLPEPGSMVLLATGLAALGRRALRRRN